MYVFLILAALFILLTPSIIWKCKTETPLWSLTMVRFVVYNVLLSLTFVGWFGIMFWALSSSKIDNLRFHNLMSKLMESEENARL